MSVTARWLIAPAATPSTTPDAPSEFTAVSGDASAQLSFTAPGDGGAPISRYEYTVNGGDTWGTLNLDQLSVPASPRLVARLTATVTGLTNGVQYALEVRAVNVQGGGAASTPVPVSPVGPVLPVALQITGAARQVVTVGSTVTITGTAPAGSAVKVYFHQRDQVGYVLRASTTSTAQGTFRTSYIARDDNRYYAQVGSTVSAGVLTQVAPTVAGPLSRVVRTGSTVVLRGLGVAGSTVLVHFHKAGAAPDDYSTVRSIAVGADGVWTRSYVGSMDYRLFVTSTTNGIATATYLVQVR